MLQEFVYVILLPSPTEVGRDGVAIHLGHS